MTVPHHKPNHHPSDALLIDYASGALSEGEALLIVTHLAYCPQCRDDTQMSELVGGALLDSIEPVPVRVGMIADVLAAVAATRHEIAPAVEKHVQPLASYEVARMDDLAWRKLPGGVATFTLACSQPSTRVRLLRMPTGYKLARHRHVGDEWMQIMRGSVTVDGTVCREGDFFHVDDGTAHAPETADGCTCLILTRAPSHFTNPLLRLIAPILGI